MSASGVRPFKHHAFDAAGLRSSLDRREGCTRLRGEPSSVRTSTSWCCTTTRPTRMCISACEPSRKTARLNPRKADLQRWRETFAERLRELGIDAEATRQATRGVARNYPALWQEKAQAQNRLWAPRDARRSGEHASRTRADAAAAWLHLAEALSRSADPRDRQMAPHCAASATRCQISARQAISVSITEPSQQWGGRQVDPPALTR
jgi:hypothetical protein